MSTKNPVPLHGAADGRTPPSPGSLAGFTLLFFFVNFYFFFKISPFQVTLIAVDYSKLTVIFFCTYEKT